MNEKVKYASEWNNSANYFSEHKSYEKLAKIIEEYNTVLEIGCGTGQSTLALLEAGHKVIAVDQNPYCVKMAKKLVEEKGYSIKKSINDLIPKSVFFCECDITDPSFKDKISQNILIDIVICWNIGTYMDKEKLNNILPKMIEYGLTCEQIRDNFESSYGELIVWHACRVAKIKKCAIQIVDRRTTSINSYEDSYYKDLKKEFEFNKIEFSNIEATTLSQSGRKLISNGQVLEQNILSVTFVSVLMK